MSVNVPYFALTSMTIQVLFMLHFYKKSRHAKSDPFLMKYHLKKTRSSCCIVKKHPRLKLPDPLCTRAPGIYPPSPPIGRPERKSWSGSVPNSVPNSSFSNTFNQLWSSSGLCPWATFIYIIY